MFDEELINPGGSDDFGTDLFKVYWNKAIFLLKIKKPKVILDLSHALIRTEGSTARQSETQKKTFVIDFLKREISFRR